jgi:hypothetical protein
MSIRSLKLIAKRKEIAASDDPLTELRQLMRRHIALTRASVALDQMSSDKEAREDIPQRGLKKGDKIPNVLPEDTKAELQVMSDKRKKEAGKLETLLLRELRKLPVYNLFLKHIKGCGPVIASHLLTSINIRVAVKPSQLIRYCGFGVGADGKADHATKGQVLCYNKNLKVALYQFMTMGRMSSGGVPNNKYQQIWADYKYGIKTGPGWFAKPTKSNPDAGELRRAGDIVKSMGWVDATGRRKATSVFLEDLYIVWRAIEGLEVWPAYHAKQLGHFHGGKVCNNTPAMLTVEQALELVSWKYEQALALTAE